MSTMMEGIKGVGCSTGDTEVRTYQATTGQTAPLVDAGATDVGVSVTNSAGKLTCVFLHAVGGAAPEQFGVEFSLAFASGPGLTPSALMQHTIKGREFHTFSVCSSTMAPAPVMFTPCGTGAPVLDQNPAAHMFVLATPGFLGMQPAIEFRVTMINTGQNRWGAVGYRSAGGGSQMQNLNIMGCDMVNAGSVVPFETFTMATGKPTLATSPNVMGNYVYGGGQLNCHIVRTVDATLQFGVDFDFATASGPVTGPGVIPSTWQQHTVRTMTTANVAPCPTPAPDTPAPAMIMCDAYTCPAGYQDKAAKATILCGATVFDCSEAKCCDNILYCTAHTCTNPFADKAGKAAIVCPGMPPSCDDATCCDMGDFMCVDFTCLGANGFQDKAGKATLPCGMASTDCNEARCC
eukprot:Rhum_TRINITY_DN14122_c1_g1::Rhum_TRINITY_DN14122_c1_g1_i1::g.69879::m.69879